MCVLFIFNRFKYLSPSKCLDPRSAQLGSVWFRMGSVGDPHGSGNAVKHTRIENIGFTSTRLESRLDPRGSIIKSLCTLHFKWFQLHFSIRVVGSKVNSTWIRMGSVGDPHGSGNDVKHGCMENMCFTWTRLWIQVQSAWNPK